MQGHAKLGGVSREDAEAVHRELRMIAPFGAVWAIADWDGSGCLSEPQFLLFMFLLKCLKKGRPLPPSLSPAEVLLCARPNLPHQAHPSTACFSFTPACRDS